MTEEKVQKIKAVMLGHAVGDALGVPVEFCSRAELAADPVTDMRGFGSYPVPAGAWSDDTSMSLAALDSLSEGKIDMGEIMDHFTNWACDGAYTPTDEMFDIGRTCLDAIHKHITAPTLAPTACGMDGEYANGNGSLMRIHPFALMFWARPTLRPDLDNIIDDASALTHTHERSRLACRVFTRILLALLDDPRKEAVFPALQAARERYRNSNELHHYVRLFDPSLALLPTDGIRSTGYVVDTLEAALWCLLTTDSYRDCVLRAVNLGDDTDTTAAVAGALAGALYGYESIPKTWLETLIRREYIEEMCEKAGTAWDENTQ
ncbi:MAG: ADP-ribosylglycohydrolase family protein [Clostridia bacterium]|nr:ADP-ribosylglycohydrolase family protein [Clostridia bacterium]